MTKLERLRVTVVAKRNYVELSKERIATKVVSIVRERNELEAAVGEPEWFPNESLTRMMDHRDR